MMHFRRYLVPVSRLTALLLLSVITISTFAQQEEVLSIAWSPDGTQIAVGSGIDLCDFEHPEKFKIAFYDAETGSEVDYFNAYRCTARALDWNSDGSKLVSTGGASDGVGIVWDMIENRVIAFSPAYSMPGRTMDRWSPDDSRIANISEAVRNITIWDPSSGDTISLISTYDRWGSYSLDWKSDGTQIITGNDDGKAVIWNANTGQEVAVLAGHRGIVSAVDWSADDLRIATGGWDNTIQIWDAQTFGLQYQLTTHTDDITMLAFSPDGQRLASSSYDGTVRIWDVQTGLLLDVFTTANPVYAVEWNPTENKLAFGGAGSTSITIVEPELPPALKEVECGR
jgi:WD40 repeat protein